MKTCILIFGRMNPVHIGHGILFNKALELKEQNPSYDIKIFFSTVQNRSNILSYEEKLETVCTFYPEICSYIDNSYDTLFDILRGLNSDYDNVILLTGEDRVQPFSTLIEKYNNDLYEYTFEVLNCGSRDNDYSSTKLKEYVRTGDFERFCTLVTGTIEQKRSYFSLIKNNLT